MIPLVDLRRQFQSLKREIIEQMEQVIDSGHYVLGPKVTALEEKLRQRLQVDHVITVANGTDALTIALDACGIGSGDEVITTPYTFFATAEAISRVGATPVFVDIDRETYNIDPNLVEKKITPATKAILAVHVFGQPAEMSALQQIAKAHRLLLIEDACQAFGSTYRGKPVGSLSDVACFSFFPSKNLGTMGDGGMIATSDAGLAETIRKLRHHGSSKKYFHDRIGYNSRLDEIHAAILLVLLEHIDDWNERRRERAAKYREKLKSVTRLRINPEMKEGTHIYHLFCVEADHRKQWIDYFHQKQIQCGIYYPCPLHLQKAYEHLGYQKGDLPVAERMSECLLALPMSPFLSESEQDDVISAILDFERSTDGCCDSV